MVFVTQEPGTDKEHEGYGDYDYGEGGEQGAADGSEEIPDTNRRICKAIDLRMRF